MKDLFMGADGKIDPNYQAFLDFKHWDRPMLCQTKADGIWCAAIKVKGVVQLFSRTGREKKNDQLQPTIEALTDFIPDDSILVGELGFGSEVETARAKRVGYHRFVTFDVLLWETKSYSNMLAFDRHEFIESIIEIKEGEIIELVGSELLDGSPHDNRDRAWDAYEVVLAKGGEGLMLKENIPYICQTRSKQIYKVKKKISKEFVIMGFEQTVAPTFLAKGLTVATIICGLYKDGILSRITTVGSFDSDYRRKFTDSPDDYIGKVVEIGGNEIFRSGALRHPFFIKFREDKDHGDCVF